MTRSGGEAPHTSPPDGPSQVRLMIEHGYAQPIQAHIKGGYIHFEFLGGVYDGVRMRLYPPFLRRITLGNEVYAWSEPKNGRSKRFTYRLEE